MKSFKTLVDGLKEPSESIQEGKIHNSDIAAIKVTVDSEFFDAVDNIMNNTKLAGDFDLDTYEKVSDIYYKAIKDASKQIVSDLKKVK